MDLILNGEVLQVSAGSTVAELLQILKIDSKLIAIEVNAMIVPRSQFAHKLLQANDKVEIIKAIGGG